MYTYEINFKNGDLLAAVNVYIEDEIVILVDYMREKTKYNKSDIVTVIEKRFFMGKVQEKVLFENKEEEKEMTVAELRNEVEHFEKYDNIYMNFSVDSKGVWGLPEGDRTQHFLNNKKLEKYRSFLEHAITHYTNMTNFFRHDLDYAKKLKKYKLYLKRLINALSKLNELEKTNKLTLEEIASNWTYDECEDIYLTETQSHGNIMYIPTDNIFIVNEGTKQEYETNLNEVSKILKGA